MRHLLALMSLMYITVIIGNCRNFSYTLVVSSALSQNYLCYFSFTKLKIYQRPQVPLKRKKKKIQCIQIGNARLDTQTTAHSDGSVTGTNLHKYILCLLPPFLLNFPPKLTLSHVKGVSEQHKENECLLQQPEEEGHWIQSRARLPAP